MPIIATNINNDASDAYDISTANWNVTVAYGVSLNGYDTGLACKGSNWVLNNGSINGAPGVDLIGAANTLWNSSAGEILGTIAIKSPSGSNDNFVLNDGRVFGSSSAVTFDTAIGNKLINDGTLTGTTAVDMISQTDLLFVNGGVVSGTLSAIQTSGDVGDSIVNRGIVEGGVVLASTNTTFRNSGAIHGFVAFGGGTNLFNGRGGTVEGAITGGTGADTLIAGIDGETLDGGAGKNALTGGAGADVFVFSALGAGDFDTIKGFSVAADTLEFRHSAFAALIAGKTPVFSIATHATSAADHLFYNNATGNLSYDPDGSGATKADLIGNLGAGLKLTAGNFTVV